jgi:hypothetical protein
MFINQYGRHPPDVNSIKAWYEKFNETDSVGDLKRSGRPRSNEETVDVVRNAFQRNPKKSTLCASRKLSIPKNTVVKILQKHLHLHAYTLQIVQALQPNDRPRRAAFATEILHRIDEDNDYLKRVVFSDEATFHISGKVNRHNVRIWGRNISKPMDWERWSNTMVRQTLPISISFYESI